VKLKQKQNHGERERVSLYYINKLQLVLRVQARKMLGLLNFESRYNIHRYLESGSGFGLYHLNHVFFDRK